MKKDLSKWVTADFETTTEKFYLENGYTKVWLWAISNNEGHMIAYGEDIDSFMSYCTNNLNGYIIYFHNLKFDGSYILSYLLEHQVEYKDKIASRDKKCYNTLISNEGQYYQITYHPYAQNTFSFQDSLKLLPFKVAKIAEDFNLPIKKGIIDYDNYIVNEETLSYIQNDVEIVALALKEIKALGMNSMTTASCAYNNFSAIFPFMSSYFPELDTEYLEKYRLAYRGGRSQVNPLYEGKILYNVRRYDINSMYPYIMSELPLPVGKPIKINTIGQYEFELYEIDVKFKLKEGHLPCLLKKNVMFGDGSYYIESDGLERICISNIDYELLLRHYDIEIIIFVEKWGFRTQKGIFKRYVDYWYDIKSKNKGAKRMVAKLMLNSLYGKFGSRCMGKSKIPFLDELGILSMKSTEEMPMKKYYLPVAIAIVSHAHMLIDNGIRATGVSNFVYCDTDSIHTLGLLPDDLVDNKKLGKFKLEGEELKSRYIRQKTYVYCELEDNEITYTITCAGMDDNTKAYALDTYGDKIFDVFEKGFKVDGFKLMPQMVRGGTVLVRTSFEVRQ